MQVIDDAFNYVNNISIEKFILNELFVNDANNYLKNELPNVVSIENLKRGINLLNYFNKTKIILSGHDIPLNGNFLSSNCFLDIVSELFTNDKRITDPILKLDTNLVRYILLDENGELDSFSKNKIQQDKFKKMDSVKFNKIIKQLVKLRFIRIIKRKNKHGPSSEMILRLDIETLNIDQIDLLKNNDIEVDNKLLKICSELKETSELSEPSDESDSETDTGKRDTELSNRKSLF